MSCGGKDQSKIDAVRAVMVEVQQDLLRMLTRRIGSQDEAVDVLHDFYVKVLSHVDDVRDIEKLRGWMRRVLESTLIDHFRAQTKRRRAEGLYHLIEPQSKGLELTPDDLDHAVCLCLYKLLPTLKSEYADVLWRADLVGESREKIASELGVSESNLRVRLHRARQALKKRLQEVCQICPIHGYMDCSDDCLVANKKPAGPSREL